MQLVKHVPILCPKLHHSLLEDTKLVLHAQVDDGNGDLDDSIDHNAAVQEVDIQPFSCHRTVCQHGLTSYSSQVYLLSEDVLE